MKPPIAGKSRRRLILDGVLIVLVLLLLAGRAQAAWFYQDEAPQPAVIYADPVPDLPGETGEVLPAAISSQQAAALMASEYLLLFIPEYVISLPTILH